MAGSASLALFQKNLQDVVKGIRSHHKRGAPDGFISEVFAEIKVELKSTDVFIKAEAVRKLTYLQSIGYNVSWASFAIIEVMSQSLFEHKKIGYLAANQSFNENTDLILLTTNLFKKEFVNHLNSYYCIGLALNCLGNIATRDLSRDCISDVLQLMNHPRPYIRKKAIITMYKIYIKYPQGFRITFDQLKARLEDEDGSVVSCAVNVICELAHKNPRNYLAMAPKFFKLLTTSSNNWMLIKVVKLLGSLVPVEPRLARKLLEPLATIVQNTSAKSLQFECIHTVTLALPFTKREDGTDAKNVPAVLNLCLHHLKDLVTDEDPNLKYLGLVGLLSLLNSHPRVVLEQRGLVLDCLADADETIRSKALELLVGVVTKKTLIDLVQQLLKHLQTAEGAYKDEIITKILQMGSRGRYALVTDFLWYISVLQRLACVSSSGCVNSSGDLNDNVFTSDAMAGPAVSQDISNGYSYDSTTRYSKHGREVSEQLMEIALRVENSRPFVVECMVSLLMNSQLLLQGQARQTVSEVFMAASWIVGEYSDVLMAIMLDKNQSNEDSSDSDAESEVSDKDNDDGYWIEGPDGTELRSRWRKLPLHLLLIETLLHPRVLTLPPRVQGSFLHAALKIFVASLTQQFPPLYLGQIVSYLRLRLSLFLESVHVEVQERSSCFHALLVELHILPFEEDGGIFRDTKMEKDCSNSGTDKSDDEKSICEDNNNQTVDDLLIFLPEDLITFQPALTSNGEGTLKSRDVDRAAPDIAAAQYAHHSSVLGIQPSSLDRRGAEVALSHHNTLRILTAEQFYTVHPKAQRKVPIPVGVDLDLAHDACALNKIMTLTEPVIPTLATLSFFNSSKSLGSDQPLMKSFADAQNYDEERSEPSRLTLTNESSPCSALDSNRYHKEKEHYYIKSNKDIKGDMSDDECENDSGILASRVEYEDILVGSTSTQMRRKDRKSKYNSKNYDTRGKSSKRKDRNRTGKIVHHKGGHPVINMVDVIPGGNSGVDSDDECIDSLELGKNKNGKKKSRRSTSDVDDYDSDAGLEDIDITRPLRASDVLPTRKHHVTSSQWPPKDDAISGSETPDTGKRRKERKKLKKSKTKAVVNDMLEANTKERIGHCTGKKMKSVVWLPLYTHPDGAVDVSYSIMFSDWNSGPGNVDICYRVENRSSVSTVTISSQITAVSPPLSLLTETLLTLPDYSANCTPSFELAKGLAPGEELIIDCLPEQTLSMEFDLENILKMVHQRQGITLCLRISLQGKETGLLNTADVESPTSSQKFSLIPTICSFCKPLSICSDDFTSLLANMKGDVGFARGKTRLEYSPIIFAKPKKLFKLMANYLHAFVVECVGDGQAMSLCSRLGPQEKAGCVTICTLLKSSKDCDFISVEVQCFDRCRLHSADICRGVVDAVVAAVELMDLR